MSNNSVRAKTKEECGLRTGWSLDPIMNQPLSVPRQRPMEPPPRPLIQSCQTAASHPVFNFHYVSCWRFPHLPHLWQTLLEFSPSPLFSLPSKPWLHLNYCYRFFFILGISRELKSLELRTLLVGLPCSFLLYSTLSQFSPSPSLYFTNA